MVRVLVLAPEGAGGLVRARLGERLRRSHHVVISTAAALARAHDPVARSLRSSRV